MNLYAISVSRITFDPTPTCITDPLNTVVRCDEPILDCRALKHHTIQFQYFKRHLKSQNVYINRDLGVNQDNLVREAQTVHLDLWDLVVKLESEEHQDHKVNKDHRDPRDHLVHEGLEDQLDSLVRKENRDQEDPQDLQVLFILRLFCCFAVFFGET